MSKKPWMKWYPADWRQEPSLRMCSRAARSFWMDLLGLMHEAEPYGHLLINGKVPSEKQIAAVLGDSVRDVSRWLAELLDAGVYSQTETGVIFSRRMVRDEERASEGRAWVGKRWANREDDRDPNRVPTPENNVDPITQRLEARDQRPEKEKYSFQGRVVRLTERDYRAWKQAYSAIPDLDAELQRIDANLSAKPDGKWFVAAAAMLNAKHQKILGDRQSSKPKITPLGVGG